MIYEEINGNGYYDIIVTENPEHRLPLVKTIKAINNISLLEAKNLTEKVPYCVQSSAKGDKALEIATELREYGAIVELVNNNHFIKMNKEMKLKDALTVSAHNMPYSEIERLLKTKGGYAWYVDENIPNIWVQCINGEIQHCFTSNKETRVFPTNHGWTWYENPKEALPSTEAFKYEEMKKFINTIIEHNSHKEEALPIKRDTYLGYSYTEAIDILKKNGGYACYRNNGNFYVTYSEKKLWVHYKGQENAEPYEYSPVQIDKYSYWNVYSDYSLMANHLGFKGLESVSITRKLLGISEAYAILRENFSKINFLKVQEEETKSFDYFLSIMKQTGFIVHHDGTYVYSLDGFKGRELVKLIIINDEIDDYIFTEVGSRITDGVYFFENIDDAIAYAKSNMKETLTPYNKYEPVEGALPEPVEEEQGPFYAEVPPIVEEVERESIFLTKDTENLENVKIECNSIKSAMAFLEQGYEVKLYSIRKLGKILNAVYKSNYVESDFSRLNESLVRTKDGSLLVPFDRRNIYDKIEFMGLCITYDILDDKTILYLTEYESLEHRNNIYNQIINE